MSSSGVTMDRFLELASSRNGVGQTGDARDYRMEEASGNLSHSGNATAQTFTANGTPLYQQTGAIASEAPNNFAITFDGSTDFFTSTARIGNTSDGSFVIVFKVGDTSGGKQVLFSQGGVTAGDHFEIYIDTNGFLAIEIIDGTGANVYREVCATTTVDNDAYHTAVIFQRAQTLGIGITVDSTDQTLTQTLAGAATVDYWLVDTSGGSTGVIGATIEAGNGNKFAGTLDRFFYGVNHLGDADIRTAPFRIVNGVDAINAYQYFANLAPVLWLRMDEASGNLSADGIWRRQIGVTTAWLKNTSGAGQTYENDGPDAGATHPVMKGIGFTAADSEYFKGHYTNGDAWSLGNTGTVMLWALPPLLGSTRRVAAILARDNTRAHHFFEPTDDGNRMRHRIWVGTSGTNISEALVDTPVPTLGEWNQFVWQKDAPGDVQDYFLNGVAVSVPGDVTRADQGTGTDTDWTPETGGTGHRPAVGGEIRFSSLTNFWQGQLSNWLIWNSDGNEGHLTVAEIQTAHAFGEGVETDQPPAGGFADTIGGIGNSGAGPDWWWRMNKATAGVVDVGAAQDRAGPVPPAINADSIAEGGNPLHSVNGPLPLDTTAAAIYFDGTGDYEEIGVNGVGGALVESATGSLGYFFSRNALEDEQIVFAVGDDAWSKFAWFGLNEKRATVVVQTSSGNLVTLTGSADLDGAFAFIVVTNDGSNYKLYVNAVEDTDATVVETGTGLEGDWFDTITTADNTAIAARANSSFTTETTGRIAELFIYDGDVLTAAQIAAIWAGAIADGVIGSAATSGLLEFENVTFLNGNLADIKASKDTADFQQVVTAENCRFLGGKQGDATYEPQCVRLIGPAKATFRGCQFALEDTPAFGRGGIVGTAINTALAATVDGTMLVTDCDFDQMGYLDGARFLSPVMCEAAWGMTVEGNRLRDSNGTGVGWLADAQRVAVHNNQITGTTSALGAIHASTGLNARIGGNWIIRGNKAIDTVGNAIDIAGTTSGGSFARNIMVAANQTENNTTGVAIKLNDVADTIVQDNKSHRCTEGVRIGDVADNILVRRNQIDDNTLTAIILSNATESAAEVVIDRNRGDGGGAGDAITVHNVRRVKISNNKMVNEVLGIQIGDIGTEGIIDGNDIIDATTPFAILAATTQTGLAIGTNRLTTLGNATEITVSTATIVPTAHYHSITAGGAIDLTTINGPLYDGFLLVLRLAVGSSAITAKDGTGNLELGSDFAMNTDNDQLWLVRDGASWHQVQRVLAL